VSYEGDWDDTERPKGRRAGLLLVALIVAGIVAWLVTGQRQQDSAPAPAPSSPSSLSVTAPVSPPVEDPPPLPSPTRTPSARSLEGRQLATAWLTGFLTRSSRDDVAWSDTIRDITDPDLLADLQLQGPDAVGLLKLKSWRVTAVTPFAAPDKPVDTPSRQVLSFQATVTDGQATERKPFVLYAYRDSQQRWVVTLLEQPYTSEG